MADNTPYIGWEAPEHRHIEKSADWYWVLGIIATAASVVSIIMGNVLFGVVILLGMATMILVSYKHPRIVPFEITSQGVRVDNDLYLFSSLEAYAIDTSSSDDPQLILRSKHFFMQLLIIPIPEEFIDDIDWMMRTHLPQEHLVEPFSHRLLEFFGF